MPGSLNHGSDHHELRPFLHLINNPIGKPFGMTPADVFLRMPAGVEQGILRLRAAENETTMRLQKMNTIVAQQHDALRELCRRFRVGQLYLFGSASDGRFQAERSDLDFLVTLEQRPSGDYADDYLGLAAALEKLFSRPVDLVTERSIRNPYLRETILRTRQLLYDGRDEKVAA